MSRCPDALMVLIYDPKRQRLDGWGRGERKGNQTAGQSCHPKIKVRPFVSRSDSVGHARRAINSVAKWQTNEKKRSAIEPNKFLVVLLFKKHIKYGYKGLFRGCWK